MTTSAPTGMTKATVASLLFAISSAGAQAAPDTVIARETLADGIYLFRAPNSIEKWTSTNTVVVVNESDVLVFDSNTRAATARKIIAEIRALTPKPVRILINSHWHQDHWTGNDEYRKAWPGLQIVATTETRDFQKRMGTAFFNDTIYRTPRVLPTIAYRDSLVLWSGEREFRLVSVTGDATGSTVMYMPREKLLVMGDVLVAKENGMGPPPWTTNSYAITPWFNSLRKLEALDANIIIPGQGRAFRDKEYLRITADIFGAIIAQTHAAIERGIISTAEIQAAVNVDAIGLRYLPGASALPPDFRQWVSTVVRKVAQESFDGVVR